MKKQARAFKWSHQQFILIGLLAPIILLIAIRQNEEWIEKYYSTGFYRLICRALHPVFNLFPFSFGDIVYLVVILLLMAGAFRLLRFLWIKQYRQAGKLVLRFLIFLEAAWLLFYCFWGLNYYRPPAADLLGLADTSYTLKDVAKVTALIIDSANTCRARLNTADLHPTSKAIYQSAVIAVNRLSGASDKFKVVSPQIKPSLFSHALNYIGTSGYYDPFTSEAQLNCLMPVFDKPFVACHEMGHQTGFAREDEADFAGFAAGVNSTDKLLRYSAYYAGIGEFMRYLRRRDSIAHHALRLKISPLVYQDFKTDSVYWTRYQGSAEVVSGIFFDKFLKANNQPHGLHTYNRMIRLTMAYYRKKYGVW